MKQQEQHQRFKDAPWFPLNKTYLLGGVGGINSWVAGLLARAGVSAMYLYDYDELEEHNYGGQFFIKDKLGDLKTHAMADTIHSFVQDSSQIKINLMSEKYTRTSLAHNYMLGGFDCMDARRVFFENWAKYMVGKSEGLFIDGRLTAESWQVFVIPVGDTDRMSLYANKYLFKNSDAPDAPCTYKQTSDVAAGIGSYIVSQVKNYQANLKMEDTIYSTPFYTEMNYTSGFFIMNDYGYK